METTVLKRTITQILYLINAFPSYLLQEHPFIFTQINSGSDVPTTSIPTTVAPGTPLPVDRPNDSVPAWAAAILAVGGLMIGWVVTWMIFYYRERKNRKRIEHSNEMSGTKF